VRGIDLIGADHGEKGDDAWVGLVVIAAASGSSAVCLDDTDGRCVRAQMGFMPDDKGKAVTVSSGRTGCR
jgi:hypothetical protein